MTCFLSARVSEHLSLNVCITVVESEYIYSRVLKIFLKDYS